MAKVMFSVRYDKEYLEELKKLMYDNSKVLKLVFNINNIHELQRRISKVGIKELMKVLQ